MESIVVHEDGTELAYLDSGPPFSETLSTYYTTIFAVHGIMFSSPIFQKVSVISRNAGIRFIAINRRGYKGSTPFPDTDKDIFTQGTDTQKTEWLKSRGLEISNFVNSFISRENLPAISPEGKGGCVLLGWSMGCSFTMSAIAHIGDLPSSAQVLLASRLRAYILHDPPEIALGLPTFPGHALVLGPAMSEAARSRVITCWITSYFQHSGLHTHDLHGLKVVPSIHRVPSVWNMSLTEAAYIIDTGSHNAFDGLLLSKCQPETNAVYKAAIFDRVVRHQLPHMKSWLLIGSASIPTCISSLWSIQDDDKANGGDNISYKVLPGMNHFVHWDEPELTVNTYLEILS
ncbi:alpha/beta-hydrolase [Tricholoma matsutake]|nr:alpha/beta-hydrolase [Tricholoma matsutake 945]